MGATILFSHSQGLRANSLGQVNGVCKPESLASPGGWVSEKAYGDDLDYISWGGKTYPMCTTHTLTEILDSINGKLNCCRLLLLSDCWLWQWCDHSNCFCDFASVTVRNPFFHTFSIWEVKVFYNISWEETQTDFNLPGIPHWKSYHFPFCR